MYDTIPMEYGNSGARGYSFLEDIPAYLDTDSVSERVKDNWPYVTGRAGNLDIYVDESRVKVARGSMAKFLFGDNLQEMGLRETKWAFEKLSDTLHLPMEQAKVTRFDLGANLLTRYSTGVYFTILGVKQGFERFSMPNGVLYKTKGGNRELCFYDKIAQTRAARADIPELYAGRNLLRYESRYKTPCRTFKAKQITGATLYSDKFYIGAVDRWRDEYQTINKEQSIKSIDYMIKSVSEFNNLGRLLVIEKSGGESAFLNELQAKQRRGEIDAKQAHDIRKAAEKAINSGCVWSKTSDAANELDGLVESRVTYYR